MHAHLLRLILQQRLHFLCLQGLSLAKATIPVSYFLQLP